MFSMFGVSVITSTDACQVSQGKEVHAILLVMFGKFGWSIQSTTGMTTHLIDHSLYTLPIHWATGQSTRH